MKNRLIPLSDYVLELEKEVSKTEHYIDLGLLTVKYATFLKQNLSDPYEVNGVTAHPLNRFFPCDLEGEIIEKPKELTAKEFEDLFNEDVNKSNDHAASWMYYNEAKNRVLFEGFENNIVIHDLSSSNKTIEDLVGIFKDIELTPTGAKMCGRG